MPSQTRRSQRPMCVGPTQAWAVGITDHQTGDRREDRKQWLVNPEEYWLLARHSKSAGQEDSTEFRP